MNDPIMRSNYNSKAEEFARKLVPKQKDRADMDPTISNAV